MKEELAVNSLRPVKEIFDEFGIEFWLDYGTLLGAIRDGKIIEWDHDIDLSMWSHDRKKLFLALHELKRRKFKVTSGKPLYPSVKYVSLRFSPGCQMDIFLWQATQSKFISIMPWSTRDSRARGLAGGFWFALRLLRHYLCIDIELWRLSTKFRAIANTLEHTLPLIPQKLRTLLLSMLQRLKLDDVYALFTKPRALGYCLEKLDTRKFYGMTFHVPSNVEDYLKYHYGEKWEIPQKNYDWLDTPKWFTDFKGVARVSKRELLQLSDLLGRPPKRVPERD